MCKKDSLDVLVLALPLVLLHLLTTDAAERSTTITLPVQTSPPSWDGDWNTLQNGQIQKDYSDWTMLADIIGHVWATQNNLSDKTRLSQKDVVVFVVDNASWNILEALVDVISSFRPCTTLVFYSLEDINYNITVNNSLNYLRTLRQINSVFVLTGNEFSRSVLDLLNYVSSNAIFKWTSLIHTAEWTIVTTSPNGLDTLASVKNPTVDFITLVTVRPGESLTIAQKSRKQNLTMVSRWNWFGHCSVTAGCVCATRDTFIESIKRRIGLLYMRGKLRANAGRYLQSQKSVLDGLHVPVSLFITGDKLVYNTTAKSTELDGYCIALLKLFASSMGFTFEYLIVKDGGFYGSVEEGRITGIVGHLARREAAFSPMPLSMIEKRKGYIDYIPVPMATGLTSFVYKLPEHGIDTTYLYIFKPDFIHLCLGPALVACAIGAYLHVTTNSCTQAGPQKFALRHARRLGTFPDHVCLQAAPPASQSSRVLTASWSVMCFVCVSAYSAYLTSTFTVTSPELTITTFKDILEVKDYEFGMHPSLSALTILLKNSENDILSQIWKLLMTRSETLVFSNDTNHHIDKVIAGKYVFIAPAYFNSDRWQLPKDIRIYTVDDQPFNWDYICFPTNVFFKEEFINFMLYVQNSKINLHLQNKYQIPIKNKKTEIMNEKQPIQLSRFELTHYVVLGGIGISVVCLLLENFYSHICVRKCLLSKVNT